MHVVCLVVQVSAYVTDQLRRKPQNKKHKTWEGDGVLVVKGTRAVLKDKDTAKECVLFTYSEPNSTRAASQRELGKATRSHQATKSLSAAKR